MAQHFREVAVYKKYFYDFLYQQTQAVKDKINWTINLIEVMPRVSGVYLKKLEGTNGLYEIRIQLGSDIFRIFCFFDSGNLIILLSGFTKKTQKTPKREIERALRLRDEYYEEKS